jgi:hypothetical protein
LLSERLPNERNAFTIKTERIEPQFEMFRVVFRESSQEFERWTDALEAAKLLIPQCKSLTQDIRIYLFEELIWLYSREHKFPKYIGAGTYDRLARLFVQEAIEEAEAQTADSAESGAAESQSEV